MSSFIVIDDRNINNFASYYKEFLDRSFPFRDYILGDIDPNVLIYYKFCVKKNYDINKIFKQLKTTQSKEDFIEYANKVIEESKVKSLKQQIQETDLKCYISFDKYEKDENFKQIVKRIKFLIKQNFNNIDLYVWQHEKGFNKQELLVLLSLQEEFNIKINIYEKYTEENEDIVSLNQTIEAYQKMDEEIEKIKDLDLSPFEQFLYIHDFAANKIYNEEDDWRDVSKSRSFVNTMTSDYIVCAGYAHIVKAFCDRLGIECLYLEGYPEKENPAAKQEDGHAANIIKIVDEKYGIDGYYFCDACWDSKKFPEEEFKRYFFAALPIQDIDNIEKLVSARFFAHEIKKLDIDKESKPISITTFKKALISLYSKIKKDDFDKQQVYNDLQFSIRRSFTGNKMPVENDFTRIYLEQRQYKQFTF